MSPKFHFDVDGISPSLDLVQISDANTAELAVDSSGKARNESEIKKKKTGNNDEVKKCFCYF